jgi:hypothetical protein
LAASYSHVVDLWQSVITLTSRVATVTEVAGGNARTIIECGNMFTETISALPRPPDMSRLGPAWGKAVNELLYLGQRTAVAATSKPADGEPAAVAASGDRTPPAALNLNLPARSAVSASAAGDDAMALVRMGLNLSNPPAAVAASGTEAPQMNPPRAAARGDARETERRVAEKLRDDLHATSDEIFKVTGISAQRVRNTDAWKANRKLLQEPHQQRRTVSLTDEMLAVRDSGASDPADIAAEREEKERQKHAPARDPEAIEPIEILQRRYLEGANSDQRARFNRLNQADQEHELTAWRLTGDRMG